MASRTIGDVHGFTMSILMGGHYVTKTKTGRKVAISTDTYRLLKARRNG